MNENPTYDSRYYAAGYRHGHAAALSLSHAQRSALLEKLTEQRETYPVGSNTFMTGALTATNLLLGN